MTNFKLSLPTDIPWRRVAVSHDMRDPGVCGEERPPRFRSSLAAFQYDPAEEYQPFKDQVISYVKIAMTVAPYAPDLSVADGEGFVPPELIDDLEEAFPCYGAILEVRVAPGAGDKATFDLDKYPYFMDFEPKKRELYEAVTETGEVLSGSSSNLAVKKSATSAGSTENQNLDMGGSFAFNVGVGVAGMGLNVGGAGDDRKQVGTINRSSYEASDVRTTDSSAERREVQSHTAQIAQMYNLLQAFHLGTSRALFLLEPRPHVVQTEATFINGPRALEGIQEVFLIVVRPKEMKSLCISAVLETAHVTYEAQNEYERKTHAIAFRFAPAIEKDPKNHPVTSAQTENLTWPAPEGWLIDTTCGAGGYDYDVLSKNQVESGPEFSVTSKKITITGRVKSGGQLSVDVIVYLRSVNAKEVGQARHLFLSARELCTCPERIPRKPDWITYESGLMSHNFVARPRLMSKETFVESRQFASTIRKEMIRSLGSSRRKPHGVFSYTESGAFLSRLAEGIRRTKIPHKLDTPLAELPGVDEASRVKVDHALGRVSVAEFLVGDSARIARITGLSVAEVQHLKQGALQGAIGKDGQPKT